MLWWCGGGCGVVVVAEGVYQASFSIILASYIMMVVGGCAVIVAVILYVGV